MTKLFLNHRRIDDISSQQINTLRGLSAIAVLLGHCVQVFVAPIYPPTLAYFGLLAQAAVMLFFVLSGLLITKSITRNASQPTGFNVASFASDRFDRIYPPFLLAMLLLPAILFLTPYVFPTSTNLFAYSGGFIARRGFEVGLGDWLGGLVFLNGFAVNTVSADGPLWSLSYEVWYYVAAGLLAWRPRAGAIVALPLMSVSACSIGHFSSMPGLVFRCAGRDPAQLSDRSSAACYRVLGDHRRRSTDRRRVLRV